MLNTEIHCDIARLQTEHLVTQAENLMLPVPARTQANGCWEQLLPMAKLTLTIEARNQLLSRIREEQKARTEAWLRWVPLITALTGLGGVVIGLVSLF
jgi:hypothetical protein